MKIGFDISQTGQQKAGCGFFADSLIKELSKIDASNQYILYPHFGDNVWEDANHIPSPNLKNFSRGPIQFTHEDSKKFWSKPHHQLEKQLGSVDIIHSNNFYCPSKFKKTKIVYTLYDLSFIEYPEYTTEQNRIACFDGVFRASINADLVIAISQYTRQHFLTIFPHFPTERIIVAYPASRFEKLTSAGAQFELFKPQQFWLNVGTLEPRKNIKHLLTTYARLKTTQPNTFPLVFAGKPGWLKEDIYQLISNLNLNGSVFVLGYVNNDQLQWLYQNCFCLVYPTRFEGFGLPVLEAMEFGAPVITSKVTSLPEIVGNAGLLIDPHHDDELFHAMIKINQNYDYREELKKLSIEQAKRFSWRETAKNILDCYLKLV